MAAYDASQDFFERTLAHYNALDGLRRAWWERVYFVMAGPLIGVLTGINAYLTYLLVSKS